MSKPEPNPTYARVAQNAMDAEVTQYINRLFFTKVPTEFANKLPSTQSGSKGCACPSCAPELWKCLAAHPEPQLNRDSIGDDASTGFTVLQLLDKIMPHLEHLHLGTPTPSEKALGTEINTAIRTLIEHMKIVDSVKPWEPAAKNHPDFEKCMKLPLIETLAEPLNKLIFRGGLKVESYIWEHNPARLGMSTAGGRQIELNPNMFLGIERFTNFQPLARSIWMTSVLLHEQVHAYFQANSCRGHCNGTKEQRELCAYLEIRMLSMYRQLEYKGHVLGGGGAEHFGGHGPAFTTVASKIGHVMARVHAFARPLPLTDSVWKLCECNPVPSCLEHCYPTAEQQRLVLARRLRDEFAKLDRQGPTEDWDGDIVG